MEFPSTFAMFLLALQGPLLNAAIGVAWFLILDWYPKVQNKPPRVKRLIAFGVCMAIPLCAALIAVLMGYQPNNIDATWWPAVLSGGAAFSASQLGHLRDLSMERPS